jgi:hypothetical protein
MPIVLNGTTGITTPGINNTGPSTFSTPVPVGSGGTGLGTTPTNGQLLIGNGIGFALATLLAGTGITVTNGAGTISISAAGLPTMNIVTGTTQAAVSGNQYVLTNAAATTVTLPANPSIGDTVWITVFNLRTDNVVARNGQKLLGYSEDLTLNLEYAAVQLRYTNVTNGWVFT